MTDQATHQYWMAEAIKLARRGLYSTHPNPRVGCIVVKHNQMVSAGWHENAGGPHAEIVALTRNQIPVGSDIYVTLEPCSHQGKTPPCVDALIKQHPARVIIAMQDPNPLVAGAGIQKLKAANIEVIEDVLGHQARDLNRGFISRFERNKPFVRLKMAISLDGNTALDNGKSQWISGDAARRNVQFLRARASAILTSASTILSDNPRLDLRVSREELKQAGEVRQPLRIVVDSKLNLTGNEKLFSQGGPVLIYTVTQDQARSSALTTAGVEVVLTGMSESGQVDLSEMMRDLARRDINEIHTECGKHLAGALLQRQLVDELVIYMAPMLLGSQAQGAFDLGRLTDMSAGIRCKMKDVRAIGNDLRLTLLLEK